MRFRAAFFMLGAVLLALRAEASGFYYVSGGMGEHGIWRAHQRHDGTWSRGSQVLLDGVFDGDAVDPDVIRLPDGRVRMYYFKGYFVTPPPTGPAPSKIYAAISTNGVHFSVESLAFEYDQITDPSVVQTEAGHWLMAVAKQSGGGTDIALAISSNGLTFSYLQTLSPGGIPELARMDDGSLRLYYNGAGGIVSMISTNHGYSWSPESGVRLAYTSFIADPSVVRVSSTSWYMFAKDLLPGSPPGAGPYYHRVLLAHGTNPASFAFVDTNVMTQASVPDGLMPIVAPPIHIHIVMHNEQNVPYHLIPAAFEEHRTNLYKFALLLKSHNVMFNFQSDWTFLAAVTNYDRVARPETGGTNIVAWLKHHMGFEVDEHNHVYESSYNYADVAALIAACGVEPPGIVGGFLGLPLSSNQWPLFQGPVTGNVYTSYVWTPRILWGAATSGHINETSLWFSGIYRPQSVSNFWSHQEGNLPMVGGYAGSSSTLNRSNIARLVELRDAGLLCPNALHTCSIIVRAGDVDDAYLADFDAFLSSYTNTPGLRWVGIRELVGIWSNEYASAPFYFPYDLGGDHDGDGLPDGWETAGYCSITTSDGTGDLDADGYSEREEYIADTSPIRFTSRPPPLATAGRALRIPFTSSAREYFVLQNTNLIDGPWTEWTNAPGTGAPLDFFISDEFPDNARNFRYGVRVP